MNEVPKVQGAIEAVANGSADGTSLGENGEQGLEGQEGDEFLGKTSDDFVTVVRFRLQECFRTRLKNCDN